MDQEQLKRLACFFHEAGMLRLTPRSGYQFLGSGQENVAEHSFRTAIIGYALARLVGADAAKTTLICLFHDLSEARTGDLNYVNQRYVERNEAQAIADAAAGTGMEQEIVSFWREHENARTQEATLEGQLAHDADQMDLFLILKREFDVGNAYAVICMRLAMERLITPAAKELAEVIAVTDHTDWWFFSADKNWWINRTRDGQSRDA